MGLTLVDTPIWLPNGPSGHCCVPRYTRGPHLCRPVQVAILKKLRAENVVRFLGVCVHDDNTMLVTEFMKGMSAQSPCDSRISMLLPQLLE